ncbi:glycosyltransferase [Vibrio pectenicida]|uniref:Glycosyltransferase family 1 protein n=1 Tax=Vibrio pectenicida TaxID=62763 RepID=A0A3R9EE94_9VIBR|nr:glycosyltransferase [Vibrio pectenicida]RSD29810.1 glycosyltransferase family 1 protein [Vibrio pectenicida]
MKKKILFVHYGNDWIRGSEHCLLDLIHHSPKQGFEAHLWTNNPSLHSYAKEHGISTQKDSFPILLGWLKPRFNVVGWLRLIVKACRIIKQHKIDIVHVNSGAPCQWMVLAARIMNIPLVTQLHSPYPARDRLTLGLHLSPHTIAVSRYVGQQLTLEGYPKERLSIIHNGLDVSKLCNQSKVNVRSILSLNESSFIYATVGSLIHRKGIDRLIIAIQSLNTEHSNTHLLIIGDGPLRCELERMAKTLYVENKVHFIGEQNNVIGWLKGCDAFASGARSEAFGLVIAEAAIAGIPVVAPREGGIPEFIHHGTTGLLYPNHGTAPLTKMMAVLIEHKKFGQQLSTEAQKDITDNFNINLSSQHIVGVYKKLLVDHQTSVSFWRTFVPLKTYLTKRFFLGGEHG